MTTIITRIMKIQTRNCTWNCRRDGEHDEYDQRDAGDAVGFEAVGGGADRVAGVVAGAVGDDARIAGIVFVDVEDDFHQVGADVGDFRENAAGDPEGGRSERFADGEADEARPGVIARARTARWRA